MEAAVPVQLSIVWKVTLQRISEEGLDAAECPDCHARLAIHQPDLDRPEQLLGTCSRCGKWCRVEFGGERAGAMLYDLPGAAEIRAAMASIPAESSPSRPPRKRPRRPPGGPKEGDSPA